MLHLHLPPNLPAAAARNAVPVRVEMDLKQEPRPGILPVLALLQRWCGPQAPVFLQLTRAQLRELSAAAGTEPIFVENGRAGVWNHAALLAEQLELTRELLARGSPAYVYSLLLGAQTPFEHSTHADKFIYEGIQTVKEGDVVMPDFRLLNEIIPQLAMR